MCTLGVFFRNLRNQLLHLVKFFLGYDRIMLSVDYHSVFGRDIDRRTRCLAVGTPSHFTYIDLIGQNIFNASVCKGLPFLVVIPLSLSHFAIGRVFCSEIYFSKIRRTISERSGSISKLSLPIMYPNGGADTTPPRRSFSVIPRFTSSARLIE